MNQYQPLRTKMGLIELTVLFSLFLLVVMVCQATPQVVPCQGSNLPCWLDKKGPGSIPPQTADYYTTIGAIRPDQSRDTFTDFRARNGFATGADARAIY